MNTGFRAGIVEPDQRPAAGPQPNIGFRSGIPSPARQSSESNVLRNILEFSNNPEDEMQRIQSAYYMSQFSGTPAEVIYRDIDTYSKQFYDENYAPNRTVDQIRTAWENTRIDIEVGRIMSENMLGAGWSEAMDRADELYQQRLQEPENQTLFQKFATATASIAPYTIAKYGGTSLPRTVQSMAFGALIGGAYAATVATGGLAAPLAAGATSIAGAMVGGARVGMVAANAQEMSRIMAGLSFYRAMSETDENGAQVDLNVARAISLGSGVLNGLLETAQLDFLTTNPMIKRAFRSAVADELADSVKKNVTARAARGALARYGSNIAGETATELAQESVDWFSYNAIARVSNQLNGTNVPEEDFRTFATNVMEVAKQSAMGFSVMSAPGTINSFRQARASQDGLQGEARRASDLLKKAAGGQVSPELIAAAKSGDGERLAREVDNLNRQRPPRPQDVDIQLDNDVFTATLRGQQVARFTIERDGTDVRFTEANIEAVFTGEVEQREMAVAAAQKMIQTVFTEVPNANFSFDMQDKNQEVLKRLIEDEIDDTRELNRMIDERKASVEALAEDMARAQEQVDGMDFGEEANPEEVAVAKEEMQTEVAAIDEELSAVQADLDALEQAKQFHDKRNFDLSENWAITSAEYRRRVMDAENYGVNFWHSTPDGRYVKNRLREMYDGEIVTEAEADMAVELIGRAASLENKSFEQYVRDTYAPGIVQSGRLVNERLISLKKNASVKALADGRRIISVAETGDFNTIIHEIIHTYTDYLTESEQKTMAAWLGESDYRPNTWGRESNEQFVSGVYDWVNKRQEFSGPIAKIFAKMKSFVDRTMELLRLKKSTTPEVLAIYDRLFGEDGSQTEVTQQEDIAVGEVVREDPATVAAEEELSESRAAYHEALEEARKKVRDTYNQVNQDVDVNQAVEYEILPDDGDTTPGTEMELFQDATESPEFKAWFGDSKVVDENGYPLVVYRGQDAEMKDGSRGNFFAADKKYAEEFFSSSSISQLEEAIDDLVEYRKDAEAKNDAERISLIDEEIARIKRDIQRGGVSGGMVEAYLSIENPLDLRGFTERVEIDEFVSRLRQYGLSDRAITLVLNKRGIDGNTLDAVLQTYQEANVWKPPLFDGSDVMEYSSARENSPEYNASIIDELQSSGFDGVFHVERLEVGDSSFTDAFVIFDGAQVKSVNNRGTWDANDPRILYQDADAEAHEAFVRKAVEEYDPVPIATLMEYADRDWAQAEIQRQEAEVERRTELAWLYDIAEESPDFQTFVMNVPMDFEADNGLLEDVYHDAKVKNIRDGNQQWVNSLSDADIQTIADLAMKEILTARDPVLAAVGVNSSESQIKAARTYIKSNATEIRRQLYTIGHQYIEGTRGVNEAEMRKFRRELEKTTDADMVDTRPLSKLTTQEILDRLQIARNNPTWGKLRRSNTRISDFDKLAKQLGKELEADEAVLADSREKMKRLVNEMFVTSEMDAKKQQNIQRLLTTIQREIDNPKNPQMIRADVQRVVGQLTEANELAKEYKRYRTAQERARVNRQRTAENQKMKKHMQTMGDRIIRAGKSQAISAPVRRSIQAYAAVIEPSYRSKKKMEEIKRLRKQAKSDPSILAGIADRDAVLVAKRSLNEYTVEELEGIYEEVMRLRETGREDLKRLRAARDYEIRNIVSNLNDSLPFEFPDEVPNAEGARNERGTNIAELYYSTLRANRLADMLDGSVGFTGAHHKFFIDQANEAENAKVSKIRERRQWMVAKLNELGYEVTERNMGEKLAMLLAKDFGQANGTTYSLDAALEIYAGFQNPSKRAHIIMGNGKSRIEAMIRQSDLPYDQAFEAAVDAVEAEYIGLIDQLTPEQKALADLIIEEYAENFERLEQASAYYDNLILGNEENYTPSIVRGRATESHEGQLRQELLVRAGYSRAGIDRGFTKARLKTIKLAHRRPVNLSLYSHWEQAVGRQEHYLAYADWYDKSNKILNSDIGLEWRERITQGKRNGDKLLDQIKKYQQRTTKPVSMFGPEAINKLFSKWRSGSALAYLSFNMATVLKQAPSMAFYLVEASPTELISALGKASSDWGKFYQDAVARNPQLWDRNRDRDFAALDEMIANPKSSAVTRNMAKYGTALIRVVDSFVVSVGEEAVYNSALKRGMSESDAAELARNVTLRTQPAGGAKDTSQIFTQPMLFLFTQFSNQLNQIWNMFTYDTFGAYGKSQFRRQQMMTAVALAASSYFIWSITNRKAVPDIEEPEELVNLVAGQFISSVPIAGPMISAAMNGFEPSLGATAPLAAVGRIGYTGLSALDGELTDYERYKLVDSLWEGAAITLGIPYVAPNRAVKAYQGAMDGELNFFEAVQTAAIGGAFTLTE